MTPPLPPLWSGLRFSPDPAVVRPVGHRIPFAAGVTVEFRSDAEARRASVRLPDSADGAAILGWPTLHSFVRILMPVTAFDALLGRYSVIEGEVELNLRIGGDTPLRADWLALLRREGRDGMGDHQVISHAPVFDAQARTLRWPFQLREPARLAPGGVALALQLPATAAELHLAQFGLRITGFSSARNQLRTAPGAILAGEVTQGGRGAMLCVGGRNASVPMVQALLPDGPFSLPFDAERLEKEASYAALVAGAEVTAYLDLTAGAAAAGTLRALLRLADPGDAQPDDAAIAEGIAALKDLEALQDVTAIWRIHARSAMARDARVPQNAFEAYLLYRHAQSHVELGGAATAIASFALLAPVAAHFLPPDDLRQAQIAHARACHRSGRPTEAVLILDRLRIAHPTDPDVYFQLANTVSRQGRSLRRTWLQAAAALHRQPPASLTTAILDELVAAGEWEAALLRCLPALKAEPSDAELWLALAQIHCARGDRIGWSSSIARAFAAFGLSAPDFGALSVSDADAFASLGAPGVRTSTDRAGPLVVVAMTAFNAAATVETAIRSVLSQSYANLRLVVVDDQSADGTLSIVTRLAAADARLIPLCNVRNAGTYGSKNRVLAEYPGDFHAFHDSDDWMHPDYIATHLAKMLNAPHALCSTSQWFRMDVSGRPHMLWDGGYLHQNPSSTFVRREAIERTGFFDTVRTGADSEFIWRMQRRFGRGSVAAIRKPLAIGLMRPGSLTQNRNTGYDENHFSPTRLAYSENWIRWHRAVLLAGEARPLFMPFPAAERPFPTPAEILP